jgi:hypothetical protein
MERYKCPCCGNPTLHGRGHFEICELCNWEDDGQDDPHADEVWGGPNSIYSLTQARANFKRYLIMYDSKLTPTAFTNSNSDTEMSLKHSIMESFDSMVDETDPDKLKTLWQKVYEDEQLLEVETLKRIQTYENQAKEKR